MAYLALYRAYRPQKFEDLAGQEHISITLQNAIKENKIAHAYLFAGPRGTGKTTVAKLFAKAINCIGNTDNPPCDECDNCISITKGEHPDVIEIDAASNTGVDDVRELIEKVKYAPINAKYKVYIIDEVHMMSASAFNALLKTLEEPPAHIVFILATTEPHKILPTIISRCQRYDFKRIEEADIVSRLEQVLASEKKQYQDEALHIIAKLADGGMRDALSILEQCLAYNDEVTVEHVNSVYGLLGIESKTTFIKQLLSKDLENVLSSLDDMLQGNIDIQRLTFDLIDVLKDVIIYRNTNNVDTLFVLDKSSIDLIVPFISVEEAFDMIEKFVEASSKYTQTNDAKIYFELAVLKICNNVTGDQAEKQIPVKEPITEEVKEVKPVKKAKKVEEPEEIKEEVIEKDERVEVIEPIIEEEIEENEEKESVEEPDVEENVDKDIEVDFNDILNILVQARKDILLDVQGKWPAIARFRFNVNTAKYANMLMDANVVVGSEKAIIIEFKHQPQVNAINYSNNYFKIKTFLTEVLGTEYDVIALKNEQWQEVRNKYLEVRKAGKLPEPGPIVLHHIHPVDETKNYNDAQKDAINMFGEIVTFDDE